MVEFVGYSKTTYVYHLTVSFCCIEHILRSHMHSRLLLHHCSSCGYSYCSSTLQQMDR